MREISIQIERVEVKATARKLQDARFARHWRGRKFIYRVPWRIEPVKDIECCFSEEVYKQLCEQYLKEMQDDERSQD